MGKHSDGRGSEEQRIIFGFLKELYPAANIYYEYTLDDNTRLDCFVLEHGIAVELDGAQHYEFIEFFHKDVNSFLDQRKSDKAKNNKMEELGVKLIRIKQHECPSSAQELKILIDSAKSYDHYDYLELKKQQSVENKYLLAAKEFRRERYKKFKESQKNRDK